MPAITSEISTKPSTAANTTTRSLRPIKAAVLATATATVSMFATAAAAATAVATAGLKITTTTTKEIPSNYYQHKNYNSISTQQPDTLERRLQPDVVETDTGGGSRIGVLPSNSNIGSTTTTTTSATLSNRLANMLLNNLLPANNTNSNAYTSPTATSGNISRLNGSNNLRHSSSSSISSISSSSSHSDSSISNVAPHTYPTFRPPSIENLVASSAEDLSNFHDVSFDIFDDNDDLFGSPLAFDASENGLWNGRFVPPPPRPPFFVDEPVLSDGLTTCDLCTWAMPTKSTFMFEGTIEKASELGWPLTLIIVSALSALLGAIIMVTVVRCRRKKPTNNRNGKCAKIADSNATTYHQHHQQLQYNQHLNHHYPHQHQNLHHHHHHNHNLNQNQYVHEHHQHLYPNAYRNLHVQYPLPSHHNATVTTMQKQQQQQQQQQNKRLPQPLPLHYVSNSCSSSSLTNDSQSTQRTTLSTIYRPPSYYSSATVFGSTGGGVGGALTKAAQRQKLLNQRIDMFTRSLPPPPSPPSLAPMKRGAPAVSSSCISTSASSRSTSSCGSRRGDDDVSICSEAYDTSSVAYEEPTTLEMGATPSDEEEGVRVGDDDDVTATPTVVEAAIMVAGRNGAENT